MIRVLVVDDSAITRTLISRFLDRDPEIEVVGRAADGLEAIEAVAALRPDIVTLDIVMPKLDGLEVVTCLRERGNDVPIVMLSALTAPGAAATLDALARGATDFLPKPEGSQTEWTATPDFSEEIVRKVKGLARRAPGDPVNGAPQRSWGPTAGGCSAVVIAASTGGPSALGEVIDALPATLDLPILVVQHMPPIFTSKLASSLDERAKLPVREAKDGDLVEGGGVWIAPGDFHMQIVRSGTKHLIRLDRGPVEHSTRPAADPLFRSAAREFGAETLAVVLTGMGRDGLAGCAEIRSAGGEVIVQDRRSAVVDSMPAAVADAGLAVAELPLNEIAAAITSSAQRPALSDRKP